MKGDPIPYSDAELLFIELLSKLPRRDLLQAFCDWTGRTDVKLDDIKALCTRKGWLTGRTGCFQKGRTPENKGKKVKPHPNSVKTQFSKGQRPSTYRGPGHERICNKDGYVILIVAERNPHSGAATRPVHKHRWLWEKANGPVPKGMRLKCLDGDKTNTDPSNWEAMPMGLTARLSGKGGRRYDAADPSVKPLILATAKLEHAAAAAKKRLRDSEDD